MLHGLDNQSNLVGGGGRLFTPERQELGGPAGKKFMFLDKLAKGGGQIGEIIQLEGRKLFFLSRFYSLHHGRDGEWEVREG
jgi:hypothetical protein